tara:strand:+ start:4754 stop:6496 length:1743 start_codon:yes stop_codon:yes gene_type:complete
VNSYQGQNQNSRLFGFSYKEDELEEISKISPVPPNMDDGVTVAAGGLYGYSVDLDQSAGKDYELIRRYRCMAMHPEIDSAVEDIVNEAIVADTNDQPVAIDLSNLDVSERIKTIIREEFSYILHLLDFNNKAHEMFRRFYVDGRIFYQKVIDLNAPERGITDIRNIDALKIKPVREYKQNGPPEPNLKNTNRTYSSNTTGAFGKTSQQMPARVMEYFLYNKKGMNYMGRSFGNSGQNQTVKIAKDAVTYVTSGLVDGNNGMVLSYLNKAIKSLNQLRWMEDAIVIYRMARAPERRLFYIDVGNLPKAKAEQYLRDTMARYRTKITYDQQTGEIRDNKKYMSMLEDYWLPRREGGRGTEVTTLPGGQNLGELKDLEYFQSKLYKSLNIPASRMQEGAGFQIGKSDNIMRDEVNFSKFTGRMRKKFSGIFVDLLKTQLVLKGVVTPKEYDSMKEHITYDFIYDNHFAELREGEMLSQRMQVASMCEPYLGKYFSVYQVRHNILGFTDAEIKEQDRQIAYERNVGIIPDPNAQMQEEEEEDPTQDMDLEGGQVPEDDMDLSGDSGQGPPSSVDIVNAMSNLNK